VRWRNHGRDRRGDGIPFIPLGCIVVPFRVSFYFWEDIVTTYIIHREHMYETPVKLLLGAIRYLLYDIANIVDPTNSNADPLLVNEFWEMRIKHFRGESWVPYTPGLNLIHIAAY